MALAAHKHKSRKPESRMDVLPLASIWRSGFTGPHMSGDDEISTIALAANGNRLAMRTLVDRHKGAIYGLAFNMLGRAEDAQDVTQETFLRAWKILPKWRADAKFSTWLHQVALNLCYDQLRKKRPALFAEPPEMTDPAMQPDSSLAQSQMQAAVRAAIAQLPPRQAAALTLTSLQGHANAAAASIMKIKPEALDSLLARARRNLKTYLIPLKETL